MSEPILPVVLLCALPASGKSETRAYLRSLPPEQSRKEFKIGFPTVQLDDYPYVEVLKFFDRELAKNGQERLFYYNEYYTFKNPYMWGVLVLMLNEDYDDVTHNKVIDNKCPAKWMCDRIIANSKKLGLEDPFAKVPASVMEKVYERYNDHCGAFLKERNAYCSSYTPEQTIIIEFARGGGCGYERYPDFFPLPEPFGYQYSLSLFSSSILLICSLLYIQVTPSQSLLKNESRAPPKGYTGSTDIFHSVSDTVMYHDYGCDDIQYLLKIGGGDGVKVVKREIGEGESASSSEPKTYFIPVGIFDNTEDLTTFCRGDPKEWDEGSKKKIHSAMTKAFTNLLSQWKSLHH